jgi:hypothetical protein
MWRRIAKSTIALTLSAPLSAGILSSSIFSAGASTGTPKAFSAELTDEPPVKGTPWDNA